MIDADEVIDTLDGATYTLQTRTGPALMDARVGDALLAWMTHVADEAREHRDELDQIGFPATGPLLAYAYHHPLSLARALLDDPCPNAPTI